MSITSSPANNIYQLISNTAQEFPNHSAITFIKGMEPSFTEDTISYSQLLANINQTARMFHELHATQDDKPMVVSFLLPNTPQASAILWAAESIGIANPLNPLLNEDALVSLMEKAGTDIIIALGPNPMSDIWQKSLAASQRSTKKPTLISALIPMPSNCLRT